MIVEILLALGLLVQGCILYFVWPASKPRPRSKEASACIHDALMQGVQACGLRHDTGLLDDIARTGKIGEVLYHASVNLGRPIRTITDLHDLLVK